MGTCSPRHPARRRGLRNESGAFAVSGGRGEEEGQVTHERGARRTQIGREGTAHARARAQAQLRRADQAREGPARHARRAPGADRRGLRVGTRGGPRPAQVVGALPRQAEDRDVHAPDQAARGPGDSRAAAGRRRALPSVREDRGRALDAADDSAPLPRARLAAGGVPPPRRGRTDDRRRVRRRGPQRDRLPRRGSRARRAVRRHSGHRGRDDVLLRQPRLLRPAAEAQDHRLRLRAPLQRTGDQLHRSRRGDPRRGARLRRARRRRPLVGAAAGA